MKRRSLKIKETSLSFLLDRKRFLIVNFLLFDHLFFFFFLSYSKEDFPWKLVKFYSKVFVIGDLDLESGIVERFRRKLLDYSLTLLTRNFDNLV